MGPGSGGERSRSLLGTGPTGPGRTTLAIPDGVSSSGIPGLRPIDRRHEVTEKRPTTPLTVGDLLHMYGLVNRAIEELVIERSSLSTWQAIKKKAGIEIPAFESMAAYPDEMTYQLVGAASEVLGETPAELLRAFGRHWVLFTGRSTYGPILEAAGKDLREFVGNLDSLHATVATTMPELVPPRFSVVDEENGAFRVLYESERDGLAPMVIGLLEGLGALFGSEIEVEHVHERNAHRRSDEFRISPPKPE